ncbi:MAG TPA: hypothetical protein VFX16_17215 [Pseudonocardiaceae bacterium]|nr:hypothetical protein [Pseudonocardiaceae bacterium]
MKRIRLWTAALVAAGSALLLAVPASASTVTVNDEAGVLNVTTVQNDAASLQVPIYIWTTTQDAASESAFDSDVQAKVSSQFPIVLGINTKAHHETLRIGESSGFTQDSANAAASSANAAFDNVMRSRDDYTGAVQAAVSSLRSALADRGNGSASRSTSHGSLVGGIVLLVIIVVVIAVLARVFRGFRRGRRMAGPGYGGGYGQQGYGPGYGPGGPGYGGGYGPGYGGGISPGAAGGIGAVGGGLLGYELGKMSGENEQFRRDEMYGNQGFGGDQGGGGDWVVGQDSDFGGGDFGGGDSGGGDSGGGGGDW